MRILFASSEVYPFSKTGGLADVVAALPKALAKLGHDVLVVSPWYNSLKANPAPLWIGDEWLAFDGSLDSCGIGTLEQDSVRYGFVGHDYFRRPSIYGYADDAKRFALFTRAIPQVAARLGFKPDIVHAHDWHTGYLPMLFEHGWHMPEGFPHTPSVFTIHNLKYQGYAGLEEQLYWLRLPAALKDSYMNYFGGGNAMQAGLGFAHKVTTVSPRYAEEIKRVEYGYGLDGTIRHIAHKLLGILNGIDTDIWNPSSDPHIAKPYSVKTLASKQENKKALCQAFGLETNRPLLAIVSRMVDQKGIDIFIHSIPHLLSQEWNLIVLGTGEPWMQDAIHHYSANNPGRFASHIGYEETLAHRFYAGADALAIPSRFEPCGLTQMIAMRYGTVPIARETGGLADTIRHNETGFLFEDPVAAGLLWATGVARDAYENKPYWKTVMKEGMKECFSWEVSAKRYVEVYTELKES